MFVFLEIMITGLCWSNVLKMLLQELQHCGLPLQTFLHF